MSSDVVITGQLLTLEEVAGRLQISVRTVQRAIADGGLRASQVGAGSCGAWRVRGEDLDAWLEARANRPRTAAASSDLPVIPGPRRGGRSRRKGRLTVTADMGSDRS